MELALGLSEKNSQSVFFYESAEVKPRSRFFFSIPQSWIFARSFDRSTLSPCAPPRHSAGRSTRRPSFLARLAIALLSFPLPVSSVYSERSGWRLHRLSDPFGPVLPSIRFDHVK